MVPQSGTVRLVVGLGNPGPSYRNTRHNVGFEVLDRVAARLGAVFSREKYRGQIAQVRVAGRTVLLLKPLTYMNRSGESVALAARNNADEPAEVLVVYDDVDLPLGKVRLRKGGSAGAHNGMKSVIERLGTREVPRLRIGVGTEPAPGLRADHVLGKFTPGEREVIETAIDHAVDACICSLEQGLDTAMDRYN